MTFVDDVVVTIIEGAVIMTSWIPIASAINATKLVGGTASVTTTVAEVIVVIADTSSGFNSKRHERGVPLVHGTQRGHLV